MELGVWRVSGTPAPPTTALLLQAVTPALLRASTTALALLGGPISYPCFAANKWELPSSALCLGFCAYVVWRLTRATRGLWWFIAAVSATAVTLRAAVLQGSILAVSSFLVTKNAKGSRMCILAHT